MTIRLLCALLLCIAPLAAQANDRLVRMSAPDALVDTGLFKHILPRFTLKTQVRVTLVPAGEAADIALGDTGRAVFDALGQTWRAEALSPDHPGTKRFATWLRSDIGLRTITSFAPDGQAVFAPPTVQKAAVETAVVTEEALRGHKVSLAKCTRCHGVDAATRANGIGSTPSFQALRALKDWEARFATWYVLNPHPSFTIIPDVTEAFPEDRPSTIVPVEVTIEEVEAILAYVTTLEAADLGAPVKAQ